MGLRPQCLLFGAVAAVVIALCGQGPACAQVVSLARLEQQALAARPELAAAEAGVGGEAARVALARSAYRPTLSAEAFALASPGGELVELQTPRAGRYLVSASRPLGEPGAFDPQARYGLSVTLHGNAYDFGKTRASVEAAELERDAREWRRHALVRQVRREVRAAYLFWAAAHALSQLARAAADQAEQQAERARGLNEQGAMPWLERSLTEQRWIVSKLEAARAEERVTVTVLELGYACACALPSPAEPDPALLAGAAAGAPSDALAPDPDASAELRALQLAADAASRRSRAHGRARRPALGYELEAGPAGQLANVFPKYRVGLRLSAPLFDGGVASAHAAQARAEALELRARASRAAERLRYERRLQGDAQRQAQRQLALAREALSHVEAALERLLAGEGGFEPGARALEARQALERARLEARRELVLAQLAAARARFGLSGS